MSTILTKKQVQELLSKTKGKRASKPIVFGSEIDAMKSGEAIQIGKNDWDMKTPISTYYYSKYKKKGNDIVRVKTINDSFLIIKK